MFTKEMVDKIDSFLHKNCDIIFDFEFNGLLFFWGGAIKSLIMDTPVNDLDFILLINEGDKDNILDFIKRYNLEYCIKASTDAYCSYEIKYNNYLIDFVVKYDLDNKGYNTDLIFYDIHRKQIIPFGIKQSLKKRQIIIARYEGYPNKNKRIHLKKRMRDAKLFVQFMNNDNNRVRVVGNFKYGLCLLKSIALKPTNIIKLFRR